MRLMRTLALTLLVGAATLTGCCTRQATFVNNSAEEVSLQVNGPGIGAGHVGIIPPGGRLTTSIHVSIFDLPTIYNWKANNYKGSFTLANDSAKKFHVNIPEGTNSSNQTWKHSDTNSTKGSPLGSGPIVEKP